LRAVVKIALITDRQYLIVPGLTPSPCGLVTHARTSPAWISLPVPAEIWQDALVQAVAVVLPGREFEPVVREPHLLDVAAELLTAAPQVGDASIGHLGLGVLPCLVGLLLRSEGAAERRRPVTWCSRRCSAGPRCDRRARATDPSDRSLTCSRSRPSFDPCDPATFRDTRRKAPTRDNTKSLIR